MVLVEINNNKGAFCFKTFDTKVKADNFCKLLPLKCSTLKAFIKAEIPAKKNKKQQIYNKNN